MAELDCRIVAMFALALTLLFLGGVIFIRHHHHHNPGAVHLSAESLVVERDCPSCDYNYDVDSMSKEYSATPCESNNETSTLDDSFHISEACLQCICEAGTQCKPSKCAGGEMCGLFRISLPYWTDAGSPTVDSNTDDDSKKGMCLGGEYHVDLWDNYLSSTFDIVSYGYLLCVNNPFCAARTVNGYIGRYIRDCDGNGVIDCYDYAAIHILGPSGCKREDLPSYNLLDRCLAQFTVE